MRPQGTWAQCRFAQPVPIEHARPVFDSDVCRPAPNMPCNYPMNAEWPGLPRTMTRAFRLEAQLAEGEGWRVVADVTSNHQRLVSLGVERCRVFAWGRSAESN